MLHSAHSHIGHRAHRAGIHWRDSRRHSGARGESATGIAGAVLGLGEDRVSAIGHWPHDHVIGLGNADAEFIDGDRRDIVAVGLDDRHRQAVNAHVEDAHRRAVDEAEAHPLAGTK